MEISKAFSEPHLRFPLRFAAIALVILLIECVLTFWLPKPLPWVVLVAATLPLWVVVFIVIPLNKKPKV